MDGPGDALRSDLQSHPKNRFREPALIRLTRHVHSGSLDTLLVVSLSSRPLIRQQYTMTLSTASVTLETLRSLDDRESLLSALKDLKNSVIGNTWKKVEVAGDDGLKDL